MNTTTDTMTLEERVQRLIGQGARFELRSGERNDPRVEALIAVGAARTFRDGGTWLELAD